jgi:hypothetical protein
MVFFENVHLFNSRSEVTSALRISPVKSPILMSGAAIALLVHILMLYAPWGQRLLETEPVSFLTWVTLVLIALSILLVMELHKAYWNRFVGSPITRAGHDVQTGST